MALTVLNSAYCAEAYDWCIVPDSGYDAVLFAGVAVLAACCLQGKFSALWILLAGECSDQRSQRFRLE